MFYLLNFIHYVSFNEYRSLHIMCLDKNVSIKVKKKPLDIS